VIPETAQDYYKQAVANINHGQEFTYWRNGHKRSAYITKIGEDEYFFTATTPSRKTIFTHFVIDRRGLRKMGITVRE